ncbi:ribbon-helix-helix protein, CopG family [Labrys neptuniae]
MPKKPFTTRIDPEILALAQKLAAAERRSITALIEVALLEYAAKRGFERIVNKDTSSLPET